jgi:hypothetical protein
MGFGQMALEVRIVRRSFLDSLLGGMKGLAGQGNTLERIPLGL